MRIAVRLDRAAGGSTRLGREAINTDRAEAVVHRNRLTKVAAAGAIDDTRMRDWQADRPQTERERGVGIEIDEEVFGRRGDVEKRQAGGEIRSPRGKIDETLK